MAIKFINLQDNIDGFSNLVGLPPSEALVANLYTDGSYSTEKNQAGYGAFLHYQDTFHAWSDELRDDEIVSRYEHYAMVKGITLARSIGAVAINVYIDSKALYHELIAAKTKWAKDIYPLLDHCSIYLIYSHIGIYGNEFADELSRLYLKGLPKKGFYLSANDSHFFKVQKVSMSMPEIMNRIKKRKKSCEMTMPDCAVTEVNVAPVSACNLVVEKEPLPEKIVTMKNVIKANGEVQLIHPQTKKPFFISRKLYDSIRNQRLRQIERSGSKKKTVTDGYIAQEAYSRECQSQRSQNRRAA